MSPLRYPCTGNVSSFGFGAFLEGNVAGPRANIQRFGVELSSTFSTEHLTLVNSGSSANLAAALALAEATGPGAHAIAAGFTFPTTLSALAMSGFRVTLADTGPGGFVIDPAAVRRALRPDTRLLCVTHFLGYPAPMDALRPIVEEHGLLVLQDACETMGLTLHGVPIESSGTLATWSFYHPHHLSSYGGGAVVSPDAAWRQRVESIVHWGRACTCHYDPARCPTPPGIGHNFHYVRGGINVEMSELNACFGRFQLRRWHEDEAQRQRNAAILRDTLEGCPGVQVFPLPPEGQSPFVFPFSPTRMPLLDFTARLAARGVETRNLMGSAMADQPGFASMDHDGLAECRGISARTCFVGVHQTLPQEDVRAVAAIIREEAQRT